MVPAVGGDLKRADELDPADARIGVRPPQRIRVLAGRACQCDCVRAGERAVALEPCSCLLNHRGLGDPGEHLCPDRLCEDRCAVGRRKRTSQRVAGRKALAHDASGADPTGQRKGEHGGGLVAYVSAGPAAQVELLADAAGRLLDQVVAMPEHQRL